MAPLPHGSVVGFIYGSNGNDLPLHKETVKHYEANNITGIWLSKQNLQLLQSLPNTTLKVIISIQNSELRALSTNPAVATAWVKNNIFDYWPSIDFRYICVGKEALATGDSNYLLPAMQNIHAAIQTKPNAAKKIKVSTSVGISDIDAYDPTKPPSTCLFAERIKGNLEPILQFLSSNDTNLFVNILPYSVRLKSPTDPQLPHYLFTATTNLANDGDYEYKYVFDSMVDGFYYAMEALNVRDVKLIVSATGWPRNGGPDASNNNAMTYNTNLVKHVQMGTPRWPRPLETYILSMYDENLMPVNTDKSYGVFDKNGNPLYSFP